MALINSRAPYNIEFDLETLQVKITVWQLGESQPASPQYTVTRNSYEAGVSELLSINISPFIQDFFAQVPQIPFTQTVEDVVDKGIVNVELDINGTIVSHTAMDGWVAPNLFIDAVQQSSDHKRNVAIINDKQYFTISDPAVSTIEWTTPGHYYKEDFTAATSPDYLKSVPVLPTALGVTKPSVLKIQGLSGGSPQWTIEYNVVCPFEDVTTFGFVNKFGVWEFFSAVAITTTRLGGESSTYTSFDSGLEKEYNLSLRRTYSANTGYVEEGFQAVMEDFMLSKIKIIYTGDMATSRYIVLDTKSVAVPHHRRDKLLEYKFTYTEAENVIPIV